MTIADDDDLPVLTQVLRTGDGRLPPSDHDPAHASKAPGSGPNPPRIGSDDADGEPSWPRALVIGSDPEGHEEHDDATDVWRDASSIRRTAATSGDEGDAHSSDFFDAPADRLGTRHGLTAGSRDVFSRSAPLDGAFIDRLDEPPLIDRHRGASDADGAIGRVDAVPSSAPSFAISRDVALAFGDLPSTASRDHDAGFALRVRDSVLQELSARIDTELDARIAQTLHAALETALAHLQGSLRVELAEALRDVVGHAVDDAVRRLRDGVADDGAS